MSDQAVSTRRDPRHALRPGAGRVTVPSENFDDPATMAPLTVISLAGVGFRVPASRTDLQPGALVPGARIHVGECELVGELAVRVVHPVGEEQVEIGALFYPVNLETEGRLMALVAGIEAALEA
jgi:hypothetical protein